MINEQNILAYNELSERKDYANNAWYNLKRLNLETTEIETSCDAIVKAYDDKRQEFIDYILSFMPKEFKAKCGTIIHTSGAFVTAISGNVSFNAEVQIRTDKDYNFTLKFDDENKCLYCQTWMIGSEKQVLKDLLSKHFENNSEFNCWIRYKK